MGNDLGNLAWLDAVIEGQVQIFGQFDHLIARDQGRDRDDAAVARLKSGALPEISENNAFGIFFRGLGQRCEHL
jgi:hypothetical protein